MSIHIPQTTPGDWWLWNKTALIRIDKDFIGSNKSFYVL